MYRPSTLEQFISPQDCRGHWKVKLKLQPWVCSLGICWEEEVGSYYLAESAFMIRTIQLASAGKLTGRREPSNATVKTGSGTHPIFNVDTPLQGGR